MKKGMYFIAMSLLFSSCFSTINFSEAESYGKGTLSFETSGDISLDREAGLEDNQYLTYPKVQIGMGYGISNKLDAKVDLNSSYISNANIKYQISDTEQSATGVGIRLQTSLYNIVENRSRDIEEQSRKKIFAPTFDYYFSRKVSDHTRFLINPTVYFIPDGFLPINVKNKIGINVTAAYVDILDKTFRYKIGGSIGYMGRWILAIGCSFELRADIN